MLLINLERRELIKPPPFLATNTHYLCRMGSVAYGVSTDNSDMDIYGVCIPPRDYIFPPNYIEGFDNRDLTFNQWQQHHIKDPSANGGKGGSYDFSIYSIVNFFRLALDNNPNVLDSLFVRREHVIHSTPAWENVRTNNKIFLHKGVVQKLLGYSYSQLAKAKNCVQYVKQIRDFEDSYGIDHNTTYDIAQSGVYEVRNIDNTTYGTQGLHDDYMKMWAEGIKKTSRFEAQKIAGQDNKFLYHVFRLADQAEYILNYHDLDLQETSRVEKMKAIRRNDVTFDDIVKQFGEAESRLRDLYNSSKLRMHKDTVAVRNLLLTTLESHYGNLAAFVKEFSGADLALKEIKSIIGKYNL